MIKDSIIKRKILKSGKKRTKIESVSFSTSKKIGILFSTKDLIKHSAVKDAIKDLEDSDKDVTVLTYLEKGVENHEFLFEYFNDKDVNFFGNFTNDKVLQFISKDFDFLFCFDFKRPKLVRYILSQSKAKCRVGYYVEEDDKLFEFMIKPKLNSYAELISEIFRYTKKLY